MLALGLIQWLLAREREHGAPLGGGNNGVSPGRGIKGLLWEGGGNDIIPRVVGWDGGYVNLLTYTPFF